MRIPNRISRRQLLGASLALPFSALATRAATASTTRACGLTPAQTQGPFFPVLDQADKDVDLTRVSGRQYPARGEVIRLWGKVMDQACKPIPGVRVDLWQADSNGRYSHPADPNPATPDPDFQGWGQTVTDRAGRYSFKTIKPAAYPLAFLGGKPDQQAGYRTPHIHFRFSKRGYQKLATQMYFAGEELNDVDVVLQRVAAEARSRVVIAPETVGPQAPPVYKFDVTLAPG
jgi:protocatechuate 3,4-dioxygenase, beta subunit